MKLNTLHKLQVAVDMIAVALAEPASDVVDALFVGDLLSGEEADELRTSMDL